MIEAGKRLLHSGLIARTWGNVSCRINENQFVITPSGRSYENLKPEEIVIVNISDGRPWGNVLPSSESGVHREVYRLRPEINFVIHTHQPEASVMSAWIVIWRQHPAVFLAELSIAQNMVSPVLWN